MIVGMYKMHVKEIKIKKRVYNYHFENLETKNILIDKENCKDLVIYYTRYVDKNVSHKNVKSEFT